MKYDFKYWLDTEMYRLGERFLILENIKRQKRIVNNNRKYSNKEKTLIMKGIDMAFDRAWAADIEKELL